MPFCQGCGKQLAEGGLFCGACGRKVDGAPVEAPSAPEEAAVQEVAGAASGPVQPASPPVAPAPKKSRAGIAILVTGVALVVLLLAAVGGYLAYEAYTRQEAERYMNGMALVVEDLERLARDVETFQKSGTLHKGDALVRAVDAWAQDAAAVRAAAGAVKPPMGRDSDHHALYMHIYEIADVLERLSDRLESGQPLSSSDDDQLLSDLDLAWAHFVDAATIAGRSGIPVQMPDMAAVGGALMADLRSGPPAPVKPPARSGGFREFAVPLNDPDLIEDMLAFASENTAQGLRFEMTVMATAQSAEGGLYALGVADAGGDSAWIVMRFERDYWVGLDFGSGIEPADSVPSDVADYFTEVMNPKD